MADTRELTQEMTFAILLAALVAQLSGSATGVAVAGDGDSLTIDGERIRLFGIDAPELTQVCQRQGALWPCGKEAANQLSRLIAGQRVRCERIDVDPYGRTIARCWAGEADLNRLMVASGYAVAFRQYSSDFVSAEEAARNSGRGLWSGTFEMPADVRAAANNSQQLGRRPEQPAFAVTRERVRSCAIKGNRSRRGEWIYHMPGMPYYAQTRAEQMFCSERAAQAAGYRRARVK